MTNVRYSTIDNDENQLDDLAWRRAVRTEMEADNKSKERKRKAFTLKDKKARAKIKHKENTERAKNIKKVAKVWRATGAYPNLHPQD